MLKNGTKIQSDHHIVLFTRSSRSDGASLTILRLRAGPAVHVDGRVLQGGGALRARAGRQVSRAESAPGQGQGVAPGTIDRKFGAADGRRTWLCSVRTLDWWGCARRSLYDVNRSFIPGPSSPLGLVPPFLRQMLRSISLRPLLRATTTVRVARAYHAKVIDHYERPRNVRARSRLDALLTLRRWVPWTRTTSRSGRASWARRPVAMVSLLRATGTGPADSRAVMKLQIKVSDDGVIQDVKFKTFGCGSAIASSSYMTERVKGLTLDQAGAIKNTEIAKELCLPPVKLHCSSAFSCFYPPALPLTVRDSARRGCDQGRDQGLPTQASGSDHVGPGRRSCQRQERDFGLDLSAASLNRVDLEGRSRGM